MAGTCIFCKIASGDVKARIVGRGEGVLAFLDKSPQAPEHVLVIPEAHVATVNDLEAEHEGVLGRMILLAKQVATERGFADDGYRLVVNCGAHAGQTVFHLHLHVLGGRYLTWPPG